MQKITFLLLLFTTFIFGQNALLKVSVNSLKSIDSLSQERRFFIDYSIQNLTGKQLFFFLKPDQLTSNVSGALSNCPYYKVYQENETIDANGILNQKLESVLPKELIESMKKAKNDAERSEIYGKYFEERFKSDEDPKLKFERERKELLEEVFTIAANETRTFHLCYIWDKNRYFKHDDIEYYLTENTPHYFEITINLMKKPFKDKLTEQEYNAIMNNKDFVEGVFVSNKMEINFD